MPQDKIAQSLDLLTGTDWLNLYIIPWGSRILFAVVLFVIGRWIARRIVSLATRAMQRAKLDGMLVEFIANILSMALLVVVVLAALEQLGINTTSALAVFGAAGLAIGLALQGSLSNFAAGTMLIFFRPFKTGDFVEAAGISGIVERINIFSTLLRTADNREILVPNGKIYEGVIVNYSARDTRRIDLVMSIGYGDDIRTAKTQMEEALAADQRVLEEPAPVVMLLELADSSVDFAVRPWVKSSDYWAVRADLLENIKYRLEEQGLSIPYPQRDVHLYQAENSGGPA